ncbi:MAG TPA: hypothetical protein VFU19_07800 [Iamia sp.]|nr:hypothetical protein [Iamia sp.]
MIGDGDWLPEGWALAWAIVAGVVAIDLLLIILAVRTKRSWWNERGGGGWAPRKRQAVVLLLVVLLAIGLGLLAAGTELSSALTAVAGALGGAALTQWNQSTIAAREADDRRDEREDASKQRDRDRTDEADRRREDREAAEAIRLAERAERRDEWVRERRFGAYEVILEQSMHLRQRIEDWMIAESGERVHLYQGVIDQAESLRRTLARLRVYASPAVWDIAQRLNTVPNPPDGAVGFEPIAQVWDPYLSALHDELAVAMAEEAQALLQ